MGLLQICVKGNKIYNKNFQKREYYYIIQDYQHHEKKLAYEQQASMDKYSINGIYASNCSGCSKRYVGQNERLFGVRFKEHFISCQYQNQNSRFA